jgi:hypothetical protein
VTYPQVALNPERHADDNSDAAIPRKSSHGVGSKTLQSGSSHYFPFARTILRVFSTSDRDHFGSSQTVSSSILSRQITSSFTAIRIRSSTQTVTRQDGKSRGHRSTLKIGLVARPGRGVLLHWCGPKRPTEGYKRLREASFSSRVFFHSSVFVRLSLYDWLQ